MKAFLVSLLKSKHGATAVEYGLILALIVLAMVGALRAFAGASIGMWEDVSARTNAAISGSND